jgi:transposase
LGSTPRNRFYEALNGILAEADFDRITEDASAPYYEPEDTPGRPSIPPGVYFRMLLIGYFEGIESERGICWRCSDSLSLRAFLGLSLTDRVPDHSSLSRIRKRLPVSVYSTVFDLVLGIVAERGLLQGRVAGIDTSVLRADASMKAIVRRDSGEDYEEFITRLASEDAGREVSVEEARGFDRKRSKRTSNAEWVSSTDGDARIARLKDGRTRLAYKVEHAVDLESGVLLSARILPGDVGDTQSLLAGVEAVNAQLTRLRGDSTPVGVEAAGGEGVEDATGIEGAVTGSEFVAGSDAGDDDESGGGAGAAVVGSELVASALPLEPGLEAEPKLEVALAPEGELVATSEGVDGGSLILTSAVGGLRIVADKGYHKASCIRALKEAGYRTIIPERTIKGRRRWAKQGGRATAVAVYQNKWRTGRAAGRAWLRKRAEVVERTFAHTLETGGGRRTRLRGLMNVQKRYSITAAAANLGVLLRTLLGRGTPRGLQNQSAGTGTAFTPPRDPRNHRSWSQRVLQTLRSLHQWLLRCYAHPRQRPWEWIAARQQFIGLLANTGSYQDRGRPKCSKSTKRSASPYPEPSLPAPPLIDLLSTTAVARVGLARRTDALLAPVTPTNLQSVTPRWCMRNGSAG